jgi:hypothetical protein
LPRNPRQQNQSNRPLQHQKPAAHVAHDLFLQSNHVHPEAAVALVLLADPLAIKLMSACAC